MDRRLASPTGATSTPSSRAASRWARSISSGLIQPSLGQDQAINKTGRAFAARISVKNFRAYSRKLATVVSGMSSCKTKMASASLAIRSRGSGYSPSVRSEAPPLTAFSVCSGAAGTAEAASFSKWK